MRKTIRKISTPPPITGTNRLSTGAPAVSSRSIASISLFIGAEGALTGVTVGDGTVADPAGVDESAGPLAVEPFVDAASAAVAETVAGT